MPGVKNRALIFKYRISQYAINMNIENNLGIHPYIWAGIPPEERRDILNRDKTKEGELFNRSHKERWLSQVLKFILYTRNSIELYDDVVGLSRDRNISDIRKVLCYVASYNTSINIKIKTLGEFLGGRHHATIIHSRDTQINNNDVYKDSMQECNYILGFANMDFEYVANFEFTEENIYRIKYRGWTKDVK